MRLPRWWLYALAAAAVGITGLTVVGGWWWSPPQPGWPHPGARRRPTRVILEPPPGAAGHDTGRRGATASTHPPAARGVRARPVEADGMRAPPPSDTATRRCTVVTSPDTRRQVVVDWHGHVCTWEEADGMVDGCCPPPPHDAGAHGAEPTLAMISMAHAASNATLWVPAPPHDRASPAWSSRRPASPCSRCIHGVHCCHDYLDCVACCLAPGHASLRDEVYDHAIGHPSFRAGVLSSHAVAAPEQWLGGGSLGMAGDIWLERNLTLCARRCRTWASSTEHENTYRSRWKHCFGFFAPPTRVAITPPPAP